jgi:hypothetical protein
MPNSIARACSVLVLAGGLLAACTPPTEDSLPALNRSVMAKPSCDGLSPFEAYVPPDRLVPRGELVPGKPSLRQSYTELLRAMGEPSLFCGPVAGLAIRLGVLRWTGVPAVVRLSEQRDRTDVTIVKLEAPTWNFPPGEILERRTQLIGSSDWEDIETALRAADVWNLETTRDLDKTDVDGTTWIVEVREGGSYQIVSRANPKDDALHRASELILRIAKVSVEDLSPYAPGVRVRPFRPQPWMPPPPPIESLAPRKP